jgi:precorrin-2/cobalt-factor-2 C20-methyltransferase
MGVAEAVSGRLYGIGVGPGDPELMTLKAARIIREAPVVAYPAAGAGESRAREIAAAFIPSGRTEIVIRLDMRPGETPAHTYDVAAAEIASHLAEDRDVALLCEGDPLFYGSFAYLYERLAERFSCTVVPGVTSLSACAASSGRPLAQRDEILAVLPATLSEDQLERQLRTADAAAIMKVGRHFSRVKALLTQLGLAGTAHYVADATRADEVSLPLTQCSSSDAPYFSMILVRREARA